MDLWYVKKVRIFYSSSNPVYCTIQRLSLIIHVHTCSHVYLIVALNFFSINLYKFHQISFNNCLCLTKKKKNPQKQKKIIINPQIPECNTDEEADQLGTSCCCQSGRLPWSHGKKKNPCTSVPPNDKTPQLPCQWVKDFGRFAVTSCLISFHTAPIWTVCIMLGMVVSIHFWGRLFI